LTCRCKPGALLQFHRAIIQVCRSSPERVTIPVHRLTRFGSVLTGVCLLFATWSAIANRADESGGFDGAAELPRIRVKSSLTDTPAPGKVRHVSAGNNLQQALNSADCGDTLELERGATFAGKFLFPAKKCDDSHWIIVRTSAPDSALPPEGTRLTPCYGGVNSLSGRPAFQCNSVENVLSKLDYPAKSGSGPIAFASRANHYRLIGLEVTRSNPEASISNLIGLQEGAAVDHLVFDRMWIHGTAQEETARGIQLGGSTYVAVVDSFFSDFHCIAITGTCTDSQAISGGNGELAMGSYKIVNNFLEASGENILFGGGHATVSAADIEIRRNHLFRPLNWKPDSPEFVGARDGHAFIVKNNFELKNAQRVLFEGNILENTWGGFSQVGFSILLTPKNQNNACPACRVTDVTIRYNKIHHVGGGFQIANIRSDAGGTALDGGRYSIHDNILDDIESTEMKANGVFAQIFGKSPPLHDVTIDHNTGFAPKVLFTVGADADGPKISNFVFTNNLASAGARQIGSTGGGQANCAYGADKAAASEIFTSCFPGAKITHNAVVGGSGWPKENLTPKNLEALGFSGARADKVTDYHLRPDSRAKNAAVDGRDLGADVDAVEAATAGAR
jgi:hypothetical protein